MSDEDFIDKSSEAMEIDRSLNSTGKGVSSPETKTAPENLASLRIRTSIPICETEASAVLDVQGDNLRPSSKRKAKRFRVDMSNLEKRMKYSGFIMKAVCLSVVIMLASYYWIRSTCCPKSSLGSIHKPLLQKLYGQNRAIEQIAESFTNDSKSKITFLYGSTGVGKTYASQLMLEHMRNYSNVFHFAMSERDSFSLNTVQAELQLCDFVFIVVDDVPVNCSQLKDEVKSIVDQSNLIQRDVYLILIYNNDVISDDFLKTGDSGFRKNLETSFNDVAADKYFVEFTKLTKDHLRKCIEDTLILYNYRFNEELVDNIMMHYFNVTFDGCKGVNNKIKGMQLEKLAVTKY